MPVLYEIFRAKRFIHTRCVGNVTPEEISEHFRDLLRDPNCPDRLNVLLDLREMTSLPHTDEVRGVKEDLERVRRKVMFDYCAIVATNDALFGMMRMFEVFAQDYFRASRVFRVVEDAEAWLASCGVWL